VVLDRIPRDAVGVGCLGLVESLLLAVALGLELCECGERLERWVLVVAEGEILDSRHPTMDGPNGMFRFASGPVAEAFGRWCAAGATHHAVVLRGHRRTELQILADLLGIHLRTA